jgi:hypothetical protein
MVRPLIPATPDWGTAKWKPTGVSQTKVWETPTAKSTKTGALRLGSFVNQQDLLDRVAAPSADGCRSAVPAGAFPVGQPRAGVGGAVRETGGEGARDRGGGRAGARGGPPPSPPEELRPESKDDRGEEAPREAQGAARPGRVGRMKMAHARQGTGVRAIRCGFGRPSTVSCSFSLAVPPVLLSPILRQVSPRCRPSPRWRQARRSSRSPPSPPWPSSW